MAQLINPLSKPAMIARLTACLLTLGSAFSPAYAQDNAAQNNAPQNTHGKWGLIAGAGAFVTPNYSGDDNHRVLALPFLRVTHGDKFWASVPEGANYKIYENGPFTLKAKAGIAFPRSEDGKSFFLLSGGQTDELLGLGDLGASIEFGAAADYDLGPVTLSGGLRRGFGGHGAVIGDASLSYTKIFKTPGPPIVLMLTPNIKFGEADLTQAYYGISAEQSLAAGLPEFKTSGGIYSAGVNALTFIPTSRKSAFIVFASVRELTGDAGNSPLILERGDSTQAAAGLFWVKAFGQDARRAKDLIAGGGF